MSPEQIEQLLRFIDEVTPWLQQIHASLLSFAGVCCFALGFRAGSGVGGHEL